MPSRVPKLDLDRSSPVIGRKKERGGRAKLVVMLHVEGRDRLIGQLVTLSVIDVRAKDDRNRHQLSPQAHTSSAPTHTCTFVPIVTNHSQFFKGMGSYKIQSIIYL
jgi:hypothetical protein